MVDRNPQWFPKASSIGNVTISPNGEVVIHSGRILGMQLVLSPEKAEDLGAILEVAAAHAKKGGEKIAKD